MYVILKYLIRFYTKWFVLHLRDLLEQQIEQVFTFRPNYNFEINSPLIRPQLKKIFDGKKKV